MKLIKKAGMILGLAIAVETTQVPAFAANMTLQSAQEEKADGVEVFNVTVGGYEASRMTGQSLFRAPVDKGIDLSNMEIKFNLSHNANVDDCTLCAGIVGMDGVTYKAEVENDICTIKNVDFSKQGSTIYLIIGSEDRKHSKVYTIDIEEREIGEKANCNYAIMQPSYGRYDAKINGDKIIFVVPEDQQNDFSMKKVRLTLGVEDNGKMVSFMVGDKDLTQSDDIECWASGLDYTFNGVNLSGVHDMKMRICSEDGEQSKEYDIIITDKEEEQGNIGEEGKQEGTEQGSIGEEGKQEGTEEQAVEKVNIQEYMVLGSRNGVINLEGEEDHLHAWAPRNSELCYSSFAFKLDHEEKVYDILVNGKKVDVYYDEEDRAYIIEDIDLSHEVELQIALEDGKISNTYYITTDYEEGSNETKLSGIFFEVDSTGERYEAVIEEDEIRLNVPYSEDLSKVYFYAFAEENGTVVGRDELGEEIKNSADSFSKDDREERVMDLTNGGTVKVISESGNASKVYPIIVVHEEGSLVAEIENACLMTNARIDGDQINVVLDRSRASYPNCSLTIDTVENGRVTDFVVVDNGRERSMGYINKLYNGRYSIESINVNDYSEFKITVESENGEQSKVYYLHIVG